MLNLIQHLTKSRTYETLKQVQGDKLGLFTRPSRIKMMITKSIIKDIIISNEEFIDNRVAGQ